MMVRRFAGIARRPSRRALFRLWADGCSARPVVASGHPRPL